MEDRIFAEFRNCKECQFDSTCKTYYGWIGCNPAPKEKENKGINQISKERT